MSETKFTNGPWVWVDGNNDQEWDGACLEISCPSLRTSDRFDTGFGSTLPVFIIDLAEGMECMDEESMANAHLIAAAPEMYDMLEMAANILNGDDFENEVSVADIQKLLSKARGE